MPVSSQVWEVVGGIDRGGIVVREGPEVTSSPESSRLSVGALVKQLKLEGDRLYYLLLAGAGPGYGWVSVVSNEGTDLLVRTEKKPWHFNGKLPKSQPIEDSKEEELLSIADKQRPEVVQRKGQPFVHYHQVSFVETKPTGLRMSACMGVMDDCRVDMLKLSDTSVKSFQQVNDPMTEIALELYPAIARLSEKEGGGDGLLYTRRDSKGPILSWLRAEAEFGFPTFPFRCEEQTLYLLGKSREERIGQKEPLARMRHIDVWVDETQDPPTLLRGEQWEIDAKKFWQRVRENHSSERLNHNKLTELYPRQGTPFTPTRFAQTKWMMTYQYCDIWGIIYHGKVPELLWDVNKAAGGEFAALVQAEPDPQALAISLPKRMEVGVTYDVCIFLDEGIKKAVYVLRPEGQDAASDAVLGVCALYAWGAAAQDPHTLKAEDLDICGSMGRSGLVKWANGESVGPTKLCDLSKLPAK